MVCIFLHDVTAGSIIGLKYIVIFAVIIYKVSNLGNLGPIIQKMVKRNQKKKLNLTSISFLDKKMFAKI